MDALTSVPCLEKSTGFFISEVGAGFSKSNAEEAALEKIYKKLGEGHWDRLKSGS